jgi:hypothetical protein
VIRIAWLFLGLSLVPARAATLGEALRFAGACDASAVVALDGDHFAVASDEDNRLRVYRLSQPGRAVAVHDLNRFLFGRNKAAEADIEGAARLGERVFWISSHGRNKDGQAAPNRHRLFATELVVTIGAVEVRDVGRPCTNLLTRLAVDPRYARFGLATAAQRAPKRADALNIEALAATPGGGLLIGFRNPVPGGRALLATLLNPNETVTGADPKFGDPLLLDLGGLGLRDMCLAEGRYYLLAGATDDGAVSQLYEWTGAAEVLPRRATVDFRGLNPEGICFFTGPGEPRGLVLSDDGGRRVDDEECKALPEARREFRAWRLTP